MWNRTWRKLLNCMRYEQLTASVDHIVRMLAMSYHTSAISIVIKCTVSTCVSVFLTKIESVDKLVLLVVAVVCSVSRQQSH